MNNTKSRGNKIGNGRKDFYARVKNANACQGFCQREDQCKYFTYKEENGNCVLKTDLAFSVKESTEENVVFGPKFCKGILQFTLNSLI